MAHTCPECGMLCHCKGDIDDIDFGERWDCECEYCIEHFGMEDDYEDDEYYEDFEDFIDKSEIKLNNKP